MIQSAVYKCASFTSLLLLDDGLWHFDGRRQRKVLRSPEEVKCVLKQYHNEKSHKNRTVTLKEVTGLFYWGSMAKDVNKWIDNCEECQIRPKYCSSQKSNYCICYGCESSLVSNSEDESLTFHRWVLLELGLFSSFHELSENCMLYRVAH